MVKHPKKSTSYPVLGAIQILLLEAIFVAVGIAYTVSQGLCVFFPKRWASEFKKNHWKRWKARISYKIFWMIFCGISSNIIWTSLGCSLLAHRYLTIWRNVHIPHMMLFLNQGTCDETDIWASCITVRAQITLLNPMVLQAGASSSLHWTPLKGTSYKWTEKTPISI